jgi:hypothetical protein
MFIDLADRAEFRTLLGVPCALHSVVNSSRAIRSLLPEHCTPKGVRTFGTLENYKHRTPPECGNRGASCPFRTSQANDL